MALRDIAMIVVLLSAVEAYIVIHFAPQYRPVGGLGRLCERLFLINIVLYGVYKVFVYPFLLSPLRHIPGPKGGNLILGNAAEARFSSPRGEAIRKWMEEIPNDGLIRFRDIFNRDTLLPTSHETLKTVLAENTYDYEKQQNVAALLRSILGDGLILVEGSAHKFQRKHLLPSFQVKVIRDLYPTFWDKAVELTQILKEDVAKPEVEFGVWCTRVTLDIIGIAGFGRDFDSLKNPDDPFVQDYQDILEPHGSKMLFFSLSLAFSPTLVRRIPFWQIPKDLNRISAALYKFSYNLSKDRRAELNDPKVSATEKESKRDILSLLVKSNDFTDHELAHQVLTMMAAGHETTSSTLSWCVYLLAQNREIQERLREEVRSNLPSPGQAGTEPVTAAVVDGMALLNAVCNETLRLYPTVPLTTRNVIKKTRLGNHTVPPGTAVYISPWAINRNTHMWGADAQEFRPERWINPDGTPNANGGASSNYDIMTFLHGPRSCIGQGFARSELKCLLAALVGRYDWKITRSADTYYPAGLVTTKPANGMWMKISEVPGW